MQVTASLFRIHAGSATGPLVSRAGNGPGSRGFIARRGVRNEKPRAYMGR